MSLPFGACSAKIAESRFVVGPGCNKTIGILGFIPQKIDFIKKLGLFIELTLQTAPFGGKSRAKANLPSKSKSGLKETPGYLGVDCLRIQAIVSPSLLQ